MKLLILRVRQASHILNIILGSVFLAFNTYLMLMYGVRYYQSEHVWILKLSSEFYINIFIVSLSVFILAFTLLGGFTKNSRRNSKPLLLAYVGIVIILFWVIFQLNTEAGIIVYSVINGLILIFCGFVGNENPVLHLKIENLVEAVPKQEIIDPQKNNFNIIERAIFPVLISGIFIVIVYDIFSKGHLMEGGIIFVMILLTLLIVTLLNNKQRVRLRKLFLQYLVVFLILFIWFFFIAFSIFTLYEGNLMFRESGITYINEELLFFTIGAIICGTFYLSDNILFQINRVRQSVQQPVLPRSLNGNKSSQGSTLSSDKNTQIICPNCDTLLEQEAIRELKAKKTVFCALCGNQISFVDIFGNEKEDILQEHNRLLKKITNLPSIKTDNSEE